MTTLEKPSTDSTDENPVTESILPVGVPPIGSWAAWVLKDPILWYLTLPVPVTPPNTPPVPPPQPPGALAGMTRGEVCDYLRDMLYLGPPTVMA